MSKERDTIRHISWRDLFPWLILFRTFGVAIGVQVLLLAAAGAVATSAVWWVNGKIFFLGEAPAVTDAGEFKAPDTTGMEREEAEAAKARAKARYEYQTRVAAAVADSFSELSRWPGSRENSAVDRLRMLLAQERVVEAGLVAAAPNNRVVVTDAAAPPNTFWEGFNAARQIDPVSTVWGKLVRPFHGMARSTNTFQSFFYYLVGGLLTLAIWAIFGGAISRIAAVRLARDERIGLGQALGHSFSKFLSYVGGPAFPIVGITVLALIAGAFFGWELNFNWGLWVSGIFWFVVLIFGILMTALLIGLIMGWPLMWATIGAENSDAFDALSRSYSYALQRPIHYIWYVIVAIFYGALMWLLVDLFANGVIATSYWSASWYVGNVRMEEIQRVVADGTTLTGEKATGALKGGASIFWFWEGFVRTFSTAFTYAYFFTAAAAIYLLLRRDVDQTEMDEVYLEDEEDAYDMPPLDSPPDGASADAATPAPGPPPAPAPPSTPPATPPPTTTPDEPDSPPESPTEVSEGDSAESAPPPDEEKPAPPTDETAADDGPAPQDGPAAEEPGESDEDKKPNE